MSNEFLSQLSEEPRQEKTVFEDVIPESSELSISPLTENPTLVNGLTEGQLRDIERGFRLYRLVRRYEDTFQRHYSVTGSSRRRSGWRR